MRVKSRFARGKVLVRKWFAPSRDCKRFEQPEFKIYEFNGRCDIGIFIETYFKSASAGHSFIFASSDCLATVNVSCLANFRWADGLGRGIFDELFTDKLPDWFWTCSMVASELVPTLLTSKVVVFEAVDRVNGTTGGGVLVPICSTLMRSPVWAIWSRVWATSVIDILWTERIKSFESVALLMTAGEYCVACWCINGLRVWVALVLVTGSLFMSLNDSDESSRFGGSFVSFTGSLTDGRTGAIVMPSTVIIFKFGSLVAHDASEVWTIMALHPIERTFGLK